MRQRTLWWIGWAMIVFWVVGAPVAYGGQAAEPNDLEVVGWAMGNGDLLHVRVGMARGNVQWGLSLLHFAETEEADNSQALGVWGAVETDSLDLLQGGQLPPFWDGLRLKGFVDIDIDYDLQTERPLVMPGFGFVAEPAETMSLRARWYYPVGDDGTTIDLNRLGFEMGLSLRF